MNESISKEELNNFIKEGGLIAIIDVRGIEEFKSQHIPSAMNVPIEQLEKIAPFLTKEAFYITVCGKGGGRSEKGAEILIGAGKKAKWLKKGTLGWFERM